ncbi:MAG: hypothetical protein PHQ40_07805 [Anaerolineaceae bacterium]|nr:hypothetical protein [Anaerolineaceae bacterium]
MQALTALAPAPSGIGQVLLIVAVLAVLWIVLKFILKLAMRVVVSGCVIILVVGLILFAFRYVR